MSPYQISFIVIVMLMIYPLTETATKFQLPNFLNN